MHCSSALLSNCARAFLARFLRPRWRTGYKIPSIENLGATQDQFDHFDFSDNELMKIENFPLLKRLASLTLNNNKISVIADGIGVQLPRLVRSARF